MFVFVQYGAQASENVERVLINREYAFVGRDTLENLAEMYGENCSTCNGKKSSVADSKKNSLVISCSIKNRDLANRMILDLSDNSSVFIKRAQSIKELLTEMAVFCSKCAVKQEHNPIIVSNVESEESVSVSLPETTENVPTPINSYNEETYKENQASSTSQGPPAIVDDETSFGPNLSLTLTKKEYVEEETKIKREEIELINLEDDDVPVQRKELLQVTIIDKLGQKETRTVLVKRSNFSPGTKQEERIVVNTNI